jgi:hypothetical protein
MKKGVGQMTKSMSFCNFHCHFGYTNYMEVETISKTGGTEKPNE